MTLNDRDNRSRKDKSSPPRIDDMSDHLRDTACQILACPRCHLIVPPALIETPPLFVSIIGAPRAGNPISWRA